MPIDGEAAQAHDVRRHPDDVFERGPPAVLFPAVAAEAALSAAVPAVTMRTLGQRGTHDAPIAFVAHDLDRLRSKALRRLDEDHGLVARMDDRRARDAKAWTRPEPAPATRTWTI